MDNFENGAQMAHTSLVEKKLRGSRWYLHWNEAGKRQRRSLGKVTDSQAEELRLKAEAALFSRQSLRVEFQRPRTNRLAKSEVRCDSYDDIVAYLPELLKEAKKRAAKRKMPCTLTLDQLHALLEESGGFCSLSGLPLTLEPCYSTHKRPFAPSVDRMDCAEGYTLKNCRLVCVAVNNALGEWGIEVLQQIAMGMSAFTPPERVIR